MHNEDNNRPISRQLQADEITLLEQQGCHAVRWQDVMVREPFAPTGYRNVDFIGKVDLWPGSEISNAVINNCEVGANVAINNVTGELRNLVIENGVRIKAVYAISCSGESCFGNDVKVNVISETGGREVNIHTKLSASAAYMQAFYRHNLSLSKRLSEMAVKEANGNRSDKARIAMGSEITNCGELRNVQVLGKSTISGASRLVNGTVRNAFVGADVIAEDFIILDDACVDSAARLHGTFVGQAATVSNGFTAHDSLIFANSTLENGESAAAFAGPFSTSMHKSTLLIGGLFLFFNAGSATNQSNHMYKLGPMHQGTLARGCKTGSGSYMLWPAAIAAFTVVNGKHYAHPDTRCFPFSLLTNDKAGESVLIPAASLASVGLARDIEKWPSRDKRDHYSYPNLDQLNFRWLSPYTIQFVVRGLNRLLAGSYPKQSQQQPQSPAQPTAPGQPQGFYIPESAVEKAIKRYRLILDLYLGGLFRQKIMLLAATNPEINPAQLLSRLTTPSTTVPEAEAEGFTEPAPQPPLAEQWADLAGLLAPRSEIDRLTAEIIANPELSFSDLNEAFSTINKRYSALAWDWTVSNLPQLTAAGISLDKLTLPLLCDILQRSADAANSLEQLFVADATKEFDPMRASLSFGIDAINPQELLDDFASTRGSLQGQRFLAKLHVRVQNFTASIGSIILLLGRENQ